MATSIRVYKPMTAGTRQRSVLTGSEITKRLLKKFNGSCKENYW